MLENLKFQSLHFHKQGAFWGSVIGLALNSWISIGAILYGKQPSILDIGMCISNVTMYETTQASTFTSYMTSAEMTIEPPIE